MGSIFHPKINPFWDFFQILIKIITNKRIQSGWVLIKTQMRGAGVEPANACATGP